MNDDLERLVESGRQFRLKHAASPDERTNIALSANELAHIGYALRRLVAPAEPIKMMLFCPRCRTQHIDMPNGEWTNPPHATHTCEACGLLWRPSNTNTTGVSWIAEEEPQHKARIFNCIPAKISPQAKIIFRPLLTMGTLGTDWQGIVILVDSEAPLDQQIITLWHEALHFLGLTDEGQVEAMASRLADACPEIIAVIKEIQACSPKSS